MSECVAIEFPSKYEYLNIVDMVCGEMARNIGMSSKAANEIAISVIEAATNAIEHGNKCCPEKTVRMTIKQEEGKFIVEVFDRGEGFDFEDYLTHIPDPSDIEKLRGRGIYIMNNMMDSLRFEIMGKGGMKVVLEKNIGK